MSADRPAWLRLNMDGVPTELRALGWIGFRAEPGVDKWHKTPYQIGWPSRKASDVTREHWRTEGDVREVQIMTPELFDGFGVALTGGIVFIDLDGVRDPDTGAIEPWAMQLVETMDSWTEISVSGSGLHIFCLGTLPGPGLSNFLDGDPAHKLEVYDRGRFAYLTGHALDPVRPLANRQRLVTLLAKHVRPAAGGSHMSATSPRDDRPIPEGQRNDKLFRIARAFVCYGLRGRVLEAALLEVSHRRCVPVPPDADVVKIARHAERLPDRRPA